MAYKKSDDWLTESEWTAAWSHGPRLVIFILVMVALLVVGGFQIKKWLAPREEALRRDVYEESTSYIQGTINNLDDLRIQWMDAETDIHKQAIAATALQRISGFPEDELPKRLKDWVEEIRP